MDQNKLKNELFQELKGQGFHDLLKKQIRLKLCEKLKARDIVKKAQSHDEKLYTRIMASLISEELHITDCLYTHSVFGAETGYEGRILSRPELLQVLTMQEEDMDSGLSILSNLMKRKYPFNGSTIRSVSVQTSPQQIGYTLEQRLALIDQEFRKNVTQTGKKDEHEYRRKIETLEAELKRAYERDLERFREFEAHSIKVKVSQEWRKKFEEYARSIGEAYERKMEGLRKREKLLEDDMVNRNKAFDEKTVTSTKMIRQKIELMDIRNMTVDETHKNLEIQRRRAQSELEKQKKQLQSKSKEYDDLLLNMNKKIDYQVGVAKLAIQQEYQQKQSDFLSRKKFIDEEYGKLMGIKETTEIIQQESKRLFQQNSLLRTQLAQTQQQLRVSMSENGSKGDRIENLRSELNEIRQARLELERKYNEESKRRKHNEAAIVELRKEIQELRRWKEANEVEELTPNPSEVVQAGENHLNEELAQQMVALRNERRREIERLKLDL